MRMLCVVCLCVFVCFPPLCALDLVYYLLFVFSWFLPVLHCASACYYLMCQAVVSRTQRSARPLFRGFDPRQEEEGEGG